MHYTSKLQICKHDDSNKSSTLTAPINKIQIDIARERTTLIIKMKAKVHFHFQNTNGLEFHFYPHHVHVKSNIKHKYLRSRASRCLSLSSPSYLSVKSLKFFCIEIFFIKVPTKLKMVLIF